MGTGTGSDQYEETTAVVEPTVGGPAITRGERPSQLEPGIGPGDELGRYRIEERLGEGGMGVVFRAHDPELRRDVALKIMRPAQGDDLGYASELALREARALAKLSHPNVVEIYDVGIFAGQLFLAMELLKGDTLSRWMKRHARPWREQLAVLIDAGRGLAAAHDKGVVHRDFKPGNVVISDDGGVRVVDFGLAMTEATREDARSGDWFRETDGRTDASRTGVIAGTPPYMAPEQLGGGIVDARSDQFSFCVAVFRVIYGVRPFDGETMEQLLAAMEHRDGRPVDVKRRLPKAIHRAVLRGLSLRPEARWPSMDALLDAMHPRPSGRMGLGLTLGTFGGLTVLATVLRPAGPPCETPPRAETSFAESTIDRLHDAMLRTEARGAEDTWARFEPRYRALREQWIETYLSTCDARREGDLPAAEADRVVACLYRSLQGVQTLAEAIDEGEAEILFRIHEAVAAVQSPVGCVELAPEEEPAEPAARAPREQLARAKTLRELGRYDEALTIVDEVHAQARQGGFDELRWRAELMRGTLLDYLGRYEDAAEVHTALALETRAARRDRLAASAALRAVRAMSRRSRFEDAMHWARFARSALEGRDDANAVWERLLFNEGISLQLQGRHEDALEAYDEAETRCRASEDASCEYILLQRCAALGELARRDDARGCYEEVIDVYSSMLGPWHPNLATPIDNLGIVLAQLDDYEGAERNHRRALEIREAALGPAHPEVGLSLNNLGLVELELERLASAREHLQRAADNWEASLGPEHPHVAAALTNLGLVLAIEGAEPDEVIAVHRRALEIREASLGPEHPEVGTSLANIGNQLRDEGKWDESLEHLRRARALWSEAYGERSARVASIDLDLGNLYGAQGEHERAVEAFARALSIYEDDKGPSSSSTMWAAYELGMAELRVGAVERAAPHIERAQAFFATTPEEVYRRARTTASLARLRRAQGDGAEARRLASRARSQAEHLEPTDSRRAELLAEVDDLSTR